MALEMKAECERCASVVELTAAAWVCSFECTFCAGCAAELDRRCPNCEGELVPRPRRGRVQRQDVGSAHHAEVSWRRGEAPFIDRRYSRVHRWSFDGGAELRASASPHVVPVPLSDPSAVDPEEGFLAALSSCHMLWFLDLAARAGLVVESYEDRPEGLIQSTTITPKDVDPSASRPIAASHPALGKITLRPLVTFAPGSDVPAERLRRLHHEAHERCFLANALKAGPDVAVEPGLSGGAGPLK